MISIAHEPGADRLDAYPTIMRPENNRFSLIKGGGESPEPKSDRRRVKINEIFDRMAESADKVFSQLSELRPEEVPEHELGIHEIEIPIKRPRLVKEGFDPNKTTETITVQNKPKGANDMALAFAVAHSESVMDSLRELKAVADDGAKGIDLAAKDALLKRLYDASEHLFKSVNGILWIEVGKFADGAEQLQSISSLCRELDQDRRQLVFQTLNNIGVSTEEWMDFINKPNPIQGKKP